jgi:hypothetical protein
MPPDEGPSRRPAVFTMDTIRSSLKDSRSRLHSLVVTFRVARPEGPQPRDRVTARHTIAALGAKRFGENTDSTPRLPQRLDLNHSRYFFDGDTFSVYYPLQRYYERSRANADEPYSWKLRSDFFLECTGWWPPGDAWRPPQAESHPHYLHLALETRDCRVAELQDLVDGASCHVIEIPGGDRIWVDPSIGWAVRRREKYWPSMGKKRAFYELTDYREEEPGIWLPRGLRRNVFAATTDANGDQDTRADVERVEVNRAADTLFRFTPTPGTLINDRDTGEIKQVPGGLEHVDELVAVVGEIMERGGGDTPGVSKRDSGVLAVLKSPLTVIVEVLVLAIVASKQRGVGVLARPLRATEVRDE